MERNSRSGKRGKELYYLMIHKAEKKEEAKQRQLRAILNKLTPQNFDRLLEQVKAVNIDNTITLSGVVSQIFEKALMEPIYCEMYANFCSHLASELPDLSMDNEKINFKKLLLNKCQEEFERGERQQKEANKVDEAEAKVEVNLSNEEREQRRTKERMRMLGNIRLIGELYKKKMLTERIMHECIKKLIGQGQYPDEEDVEYPDDEDVEALCKLMSIIGEMIDHPKTKEHMGVYFEKLKILSNNMNLSSMVRFMLKDVIDLRRNRWQVRRKVDGPKKIEEVHRDAVEERQAQAQAGSMGRGMGNNQSPRSNPMLRNDDRNLNRPVAISPHTQSQGPIVSQNAYSDERLRDMCLSAIREYYSFQHKVEKKYKIGKVSNAEEAKQRQLRAILNKLTPQNFNRLLEQVKAVNIDNAINLSGVVSQIFEKALMEPIFCEMYANFCSHLAYQLPDLSVDNEKITFKRLLLNKCQKEFERGEREIEEDNKVDEAEGEVELSNEEREQRRTKARRRMSGNIRFIGELYKKKMLTERIIHECIKKLPGLCQDPDEKDVEALCKLMSSIGEMIDHPKAKEHMDVYFESLKILSNNMDLSSRVRFMLKDVIDLRGNRWQVMRKVDEKVTKGFITAMKRWGLDPTKKVMFFMMEVEEKVLLASRNTGTLKILTPRTLNLYDVLNADKIVFTPGAVDYLNGRYGDIE
ncbi:uncharacterized protein [Medicago truncatula]|uniref:MIF4G domain protein n=1 Tax=Medicago truncatula TaxID=3880 RepID=A0A072TK32_MEDTR|nr:uncharacterized protein LOC25500065 [Medicago truncatula]KEH17864.1 MIF4G domain protein [Medicago truncatula]